MKPWEKYQPQESVNTEGPWSKYQGSNVSVQEQPDSIMKNMSQGKNVIDATAQFASEHPFKTAFQGPTETITGETAQSKLLKAQPYTSLPGKDLPVVGNIVKGAEIGFNTFKDMPASAAGWAADQVSPANIATLGITKIPGVKETAEVIGKTAPAQAIGRFLTKERGLPFSQQHMDNRIFNLYNQAVGGAKIKNAGTDVNNFKNNRIDAMKTINDNLPEIKLPDPNTGEMVSRAPETRLDLLHALRQAKQAVWNKVSGLSGDATKAGASIDMSSLVDKALQDTLKSIGEDALKVNPQLRNSLTQEANRIKSIGTTNPQRAEEFMKWMNGEVQRLRNSGQAVDYSVKDLYSNLLPKLNDASDAAIEKVLSQGTYKEFRKQYAALKSAEKEVLGSANKYLRNGDGKGGVHPIINLWSVEELLHGGARMAMGDVAGGASTMAKGGLIKGVSKIVDHFTSPDRKITKMFELLGKSPVKPNPVVAESMGGAVNAELMPNAKSPKMPINGPKELPAPSNAPGLPGRVPAPSMPRSGVDTASGYTAGELSNPGPIKQGGFVPRGLPDKSIQMGPTTRTGVNPQPSVGSLPSPTNAGAKPIITPVSENAKPPKLLTSDKVYGEGFVMGKNPILSKPNKYVKDYDLKDFNDMHEWELMQEKGGNIKMGNAQASESKQLWKQKSGHSPIVQEIGPAKAKIIMNKVANGEKLTTGQHNAFKRMFKYYQTKTKPMMEDKNVKFSDSGQSEWTD